MEWERFAVLNWLTAAAIQSFGRNITCCNDARKETCKIKFNHVCIDSWATVQVESASIGLQQIPGRFCILRTCFLPRHKYVVFHRHPVLDCADNRTRRSSRSVTNSSCRNMSKFIQPIKPAFSKHKTRREVDMYTAFKRKLRVTTQNVAIGRENPSGSDLAKRCFVTPKIERDVLCHKIGKKARNPSVFPRTERTRSGSKLLNHCSSFDSCSDSESTNTDSVPMMLPEVSRNNTDCERFMS